MLPNDIEQYQVFNKQTYTPYKKQLNLLLNDFSNSTDKLSKNYTLENIDIDNLDDITLIVYKNNIVAFASVLSRSIWLKNTSRIFNRLLRNKRFEWKNPAFGIISKLVHDHQIAYCKSVKKDYVFISQETKKLWLRKWVQQANEYNSGWTICDEKKKVTNGNSSGSIQHIAYKKISNTNQPFLL